VFLHETHLDGINTSPTSPDNATAGPTSPASLSTAFLSTFAVLGDGSYTATADAKTACHHTALVSQLTKEADTFFLPNFRRIFSKDTFFPHHAPGHVKGATDRPNSRSTPDFQAKKGFRTILLSICTRLDCNWSTRAAPGHALRSIVITLP